MSTEKKYSLEMPFGGCFGIVLLTALCCIAVNECRRSDIRYEMDKIKYQKFCDSINAKNPVFANQVADTTTIKQR